MVWKVRLPSALLIFLQKTFERLISLFLPLVAFKTAWKVFLFHTVGLVNISCSLFPWLRGEVSAREANSR